MVIFIIKLRPLMSDIWFKTFTLTCPEKPIKTRQELGSSWVKKRVALNSSLHLVLLDSVE